MHWTETRDSVIRTATTKVALLATQWKKDEDSDSDSDDEAKMRRGLNPLKMYEKKKKTKDRLIANEKKGGKKEVICERRGESRTQVIQPQSHSVTSITQLHHLVGWLLACFSPQATRYNQPPLALLDLGGKNKTKFDSQNERSTTTVDLLMKE